ncbi:GAF domain-containing sensor histidine kinase [Nocardioides terrisoli]|uniref:GAF domain-containing sensor histidine kinase n=1 Tax=Nocardioides terrisoli TaxID=3388267 RepID=UPI00287BC2D9|nr:GAF domain-containing protein [Nocardioides marmorisolisilvae]
MFSEPDEVRLDGPTQGLVDALVAVSTDLDLPRVLERLVRAACDLTGARYGALGVLGGDRARLAQFITHGIEPDVRSLLGDPPQGRGILGLLIDDPRPLRLRRLQDHPGSVGFPPNHPPMESFLGVPIHVRGTIFGNLYLCDKRGAGAFTELDERLVGVLATGAAHVIDNARTFERTERRRVWLESVAQIGALLQDDGSVETAVGQMAISVRRLAGASAVAVVRLVGDEIVVEVVDGPRSDFLNVLMPALSGQVRAAAGLHGVVRQATFGINHALVVPLREHFDQGGAVVVVGDEPVGSAMTELVSTFVDQVTLAVDRARALGEREELLLGADRERIARDLHDVVIQRLFATGLQLQGVRRATSDDGVLQRIDQAVESLDVTIREIRSTIFDLQRSEATGGLRSDLQAVLEEYVEPLGHRPVLRTDGPVDTAVGPELAEQVVIVLREALSNVARHAHASATRVELAADAHRLRLTVADDGVGLPDQPVESGLRNLRSRAGRLGGTFEVGRASEGAGTRMRWDVPVD